MNVPTNNVKFHLKKKKKMLCIQKKILKTLNKAERKKFPTLRLGRRDVLYLRIMLKISLKNSKLKEKTHILKLGER